MASLRDEGEAKNLGPASGPNRQRDLCTFCTISLDQEEVFRTKVFDKSVSPGAAGPSYVYSWYSRVFPGSKWVELLTGGGVVSVNSPVQEEEAVQGEEVVQEEEEVVQGEVVQEEEAVQEEEVTCHLSLILVTCHLSLVLVTCHLSLVLVTCHLSLVLVTCHLSLVLVTCHLSLILVTCHLSLVLVTCHLSLCSPFYGEDFYFEIPRPFQCLSFYVYAKSVFQRELPVGKVSIQKDELCEFSGRELWCGLHPVDANSEVQVTWRIHLVHTVKFTWR
ncbi:Ras GTPase-activating protein 2 [Liparis tanakae]|uniref:Ras GTPase-activating protein 2 n=1 Tax=Liparis tanakae TaxID=230148 RepID=A0A4Z2EQA2_9TELE|nr:Ras GTPase-activating protein 2 [Liparis tanakae]